MACILRPWRQADAPALAALLNNPNILNNLRDGIPYPYTEADAQAFIQEMHSADPEGTFAYAIVDGETLLGSMGAFRCGNIHYRTAELGYYIGQAYWGQGYATEAVKQLCVQVFQQTNILRIFAEPFARDLASCRVLEKAGFQLEGTLRCNAEKNGEVLDMRLYAKVRP